MNPIAAILRLRKHHNFVPRNFTERVVVSY